MGEFCVYGVKAVLKYYTLYFDGSNEYSLYLYPYAQQGRQSALKSEGDRLENEEVRGYMLP